MTATVGVHAGEHLRAGHGREVDHRKAAARFERRGEALVEGLGLRDVVIYVAHEERVAACRRLDQLPERLVIIVRNFQLTFAVMAIAAVAALHAQDAKQIAQER